MTKNYRSKTRDANTLAAPEQVSVAMQEIAADMREGLLALAVGAGLQVMEQLMQADVAAVCGPPGKHDPGRAATRHGSEAGSVTLGGRRAPVRRPQVHSINGSGEVVVSAYELFNSTELLAHDGDGADVGRALDPSLPAGVGASRECHRDRSSVDEQVSCLT